MLDFAVIPPLKKNSWCNLQGLCFLWGTLLDLVKLGLREIVLPWCLLVAKSWTDRIMRTAPRFLEVFLHDDMLCVQKPLSFTSSVLVPKWGKSSMVVPTIFQMHKRDVWNHTTDPRFRRNSSVWNQTQTIPESVLGGVPSEIWQCEFSAIRDVKQWDKVKV